MSRLYQAPDDFEAIIRIFPASERGRLTPAFNGVRWDFAYADDPLAELHAIWPDFFDEHGVSMPPNRALPADVFLQARMTIVSEELRSEFHRRRISVAYCSSAMRAQNGWLRAKWLKRRVYCCQGKPGQ